MVSFSRIHCSTAGLNLAHFFPKATEILYIIYQIISISKLKAEHCSQHWNCWLHQAKKMRISHLHKPCSKKTVKTLIKITVNRTCLKNKLHRFISDFTIHQKFYRSIISSDFQINSTRKAGKILLLPFYSQEKRFKYYAQGHRATIKWQKILL